MSNMSEFHEFFTDKDFVGSYNVFISGDIEDRDNGIIYVEDATDWLFWEEFVAYYYPNEYMCRPSSKNGKTVTGKRFLETIYDQANDKVLIAVDSDYDYIMSKLEANHPFNKNKYIIHTYGFSRESVQLEKHNLQKFFRKSKLTIPNDIDLLSFLNELSEIAFKALAKYILLIKSIDYETTYSKKFNSCFNVLGYKIINENLSLNSKVIPSIERKVDIFFSDKSIPNSEIIATEDFLNKIGVNKDNAYRFISGHILFDLLKKIHKDTLKILMRSEIKNVENTVSESEVKTRKIQVVTLFENLFSFDTYCNMCAIDPNDEIHSFILSDIKNIKN